MLNQKSKEKKNNYQIFKELWKEIGIFELQNHIIRRAKKKAFINFIF
jgi:hypothetical protein